MFSRAKVYQRLRPDGTPKSPFWHAWFQVWDAQKQAWKPKTQSTKSADETAALEIAKEFERIALAAGPNGNVRISREIVMDGVNSIMRISGHRAVIDCPRWSEYAETWLAIQKKRVPKSLSEGSLATYKSHINNFTKWLGKDADLPLTSISGEMLQDWYRDVTEEGLKATTMNNTATTISIIYQRAIDEGYTVRNPVNLIDRDDNDGNTRDPFTLDEMDAIITYLRGDPAREDWLTVALLGFCTSQRLTDCANAVVTQIEPGQPWHFWHLRQGKTGKQIRIPMVEPLASHMKAILKKPREGLFLAPSLAGLPSGGFQDGLSWQFGEILKAAKVEGRRVEGKGRGRGFNSKTFHSTRHTCNSLLANAGIPSDVRRMITGHADDATNAIYTHLDDATKGKALVKAFTRKPPSQKKGAKAKAPAPKKKSA